MEPYTDTLISAPQSVCEVVVLNVLEIPGDQEGKLFSGFTELST